MPIFSNSNPDLNNEFIKVYNYFNAGLDVLLKYDRAATLSSIPEESKYAEKFSDAKKKIGSTPTEEYD